MKQSQFKSITNLRLVSTSFVFLIFIIIEFFYCEDCFAFSIDRKNEYTHFINNVFNDLFKDQNKNIKYGGGSGTDFINDYYCHLLQSKKSNLNKKNSIGIHIPILNSTYIEKSTVFPATEPNILFDLIHSGDIVLLTDGRTSHWTRVFKKNNNYIYFIDGDPNNSFLLNGRNLLNIKGKVVRLEKNKIIVKINRVDFVKVIVGFYLQVHSFEDISNAINKIMSTMQGKANYLLNYSNLLSRIFEYSPDLYKNELKENFKYIKKLSRNNSTNINSQLIKATIQYIELITHQYFDESDEILSTFLEKNYVPPDERMMSVILIEALNVNYDYKFIPQILNKASQAANNLFRNQINKNMMGNISLVLLSFHYSLIEVAILYKHAAINYISNNIKNFEILVYFALKKVREYRILLENVIKHNINVDVRSYIKDYPKFVFLEDFLEIYQILLAYEATLFCMVGDKKETIELCNILTKNDHIVPIHIKAVNYDNINPEFLNGLIKSMADMTIVTIDYYVKNKVPYGEQIYVLKPFIKYCKWKNSKY